MRSLRSFALLVVLTCGSALASPPQDVVVLLRPAPDASPALQGAFHRLQGELALHGFAMRVVDAPEAQPGDLDAEADRGRAAAAVGFFEGEPGARVDIWISDRVTGKTSKRTIQPAPGQDAATVLAVRALELLRASLREYSELEGAPPDLPEAHPERAAAAVRDLGRPPRSPWFAGIGAVASWSLPVGGVGAGPQLFVGYDAGRSALRALWLGPVWGGRHESDAGHFTVRWLGAALETPLRLLDDDVRLSAFPSVSALRWDVQGEAFEPFRGRADAAWTFGAGAGAEIDVSLDAQRRARLFVTLRGVVPLPAPRVHLGDEHWLLGRPLLSAGAGLSSSF